jgi:hypothetical protein
MISMNLPNDALYRQFDGRWWSTIEAAVALMWFIASAPLPLLLFTVLRGLAKRARSAHLAEHCTIVGIGASASLVVVATLGFVLANADSWGFGQWWTGRSNIAFAMMLVVSLAVSLFTLWSVYLLVRFAIAFRRAAGQLRGQWRTDDRSVGNVRTAEDSA